MVQWHRQEARGVGDEYEELMDAPRLGRCQVRDWVERRMVRTPRDSAQFGVGDSGVQKARLRRRGGRR